MTAPIQGTGMSNMSVAIAPNAFLINPEMEKGSGLWGGIGAQSLVVKVFVFSPAKLSCIRCFNLINVVWNYDINKAIKRLDKINSR
jgi:hypothetical protein